MTKLRRVFDLFDEKAEVMAWITLALAVVGRASDKLDQWPTVAAVGISLITMLGASYYSGVRVGPNGLEVTRDE